MEEQYYYFHTDEIDAKFHKDPEDKDKHIVLACARGENDYIREWIEHYLNLGFEKIIICDNNDDESLLEVINDYVENGTVEVFDCRGFSSFQVQFYSMFCTEGNYKWCAYFDCDEFLELGIYTDIKEYLATKEDESCISFNWMVFGSNNALKKREGSVQERFKNPVSPVSMFFENCFIKSIVKGGDTFKNGCWFNGSHIPMTTPMFTHNIGGYSHNDNFSHQSFPPRYKEGYLKHYYTKSFDEWVKKANRGWPDGTTNLDTEKFFLCEDWANLPLGKMGSGLFSGRRINDDEIPYKEILDEYDVIQIGNPNQHVYSFMSNLVAVMNHTTDHTFIISEPHITDDIFAMLLEVGIKTGNNVVWANSWDEVWRAYLKYNKGKNTTYYILNFL